MTLLTRAYLIYATQMLRGLDEVRKNPMGKQEILFNHLIRSGKNTAFGKDHQFENIKSIADYQRLVPIREYNDIQPYIDRCRMGEKNVLWNDNILYYAVSSGTSSDKRKFIPITTESLKRCHFSGFQKMLATYLNNNPKSRLYDGKSLTFGGSVSQIDSDQFWSGDLSGILTKEAPLISDLKRIPSKKIALISDFNEKIDAIIKTCSKEDVTNFAGTPSWLLMLMQKIVAYNNVQYLTDIWPNLELFMHGGISFNPYREQFKALIPSDNMHYLENYNASEGYFAFQDDFNDPSMLMTADNGVFFEFQTLGLGGKEKKVHTMADVELNVPYAVIISSVTGLWRYNIGDVIKFTSLYPHKIVFEGRTQLFINAFGEELMIGNAEKALFECCKKHNAIVSEFTVAPIFMQDGKKGSHHWVIEFAKAPENVEKFADTLDEEICKVNSDYEAKRTHTYTMDRLRLTRVPEGTFLKWMESRGKLGGQNKVPRLAQDSKFVDSIIESL